MLRVLWLMLLLFLLSFFVVVAVDFALALLLLLLLPFANIRVTVINLNILLVSKSDPAGNPVLVYLCASVLIRTYECLWVLLVGGVSWGCLMASTSLMSFGCSHSTLPSLYSPWWAHTASLNICLVELPLLPLPLTFPFYCSSGFAFISTRWSVDKAHTSVHMYYVHKQICMYNEYNVQCSSTYTRTHTYIHMLSMNLQPYIMQLVCCELNESTHAFSTHTTAQKYQWTLHKLMSGFACVCGRARAGQIVRMREWWREWVQGERTEHIPEIPKGRWKIWHCKWEVATIYSYDYIDKQSMH